MTKIIVITWNIVLSFLPGFDALCDVYNSFV